MGFNMFKEIPKIREKLINKGYKKDIVPLEILAKTIMVEYGMKRETVAKWLKYFEQNNIIKIDNLKAEFL